MKKTLCFLIAAILTLGISVHGEIKELRRGKYLRTEIRKTEKRHEFSVELEKTKEDRLGMPVLNFKKVLILTHHEVRIYEKLIEIVRENAGQGITERGTVEYRLVPDEVFEGEMSQREEIGEIQPLAEEEIEANIVNNDGNNHLNIQWTMTTDKDGKYIDSSQRILEAFDNLRIKSNELKLKHKALGSKSIVLSRNLLKRETANLPDVEKQSSDILEAFGQDYTQLRISSADGLKTTAKAPAKARPGEAVAITVEVKNTADKPVCNLMGRSFSADQSLNGKMFYFGCMQPGATSSFTRIVKLPESTGRTCFVAIGFWTILGTAQKNQCRFSIELDENVQ